MSKSKIKNFVFNSKELKGISNLLQELDTEVNESEFIEYVVKATQERESVKFEFTKNLSKALDYIKEFSLDNKIPREDASHITYSDLEGLKLNMIDIGILKNIITRKNVQQTN